MHNGMHCVLSCVVRLFSISLIINSYFIGLVLFGFTEGNSKSYCNIYICVLYLIIIRGVIHISMWVACVSSLTHWGRVTHICVSNQTIIGSDNGLSPGRRQTIIWTNAGILLIRTLGTHFNENLLEIMTFSFKKNLFESVVCETAAILSWPQCVKRMRT